MLTTHAHHSPAVVLFGGWADSNHDTYYALQEPGVCHLASGGVQCTMRDCWPGPSHRTGCHTSGPHYAFKSVVPYPFNENPSLFIPYRYNNVAN